MKASPPPLLLYPCRSTTVLIWIKLVPHLISSLGLHVIPVTMEAIRGHDDCQCPRRRIHSPGAATSQESTEVVVGFIDFPPFFYQVDMKESEIIVTTR